MLIFGNDEAGKEKFLAEFLRTSGAALVHRFGEEKAIGIDDVREIKRRASLSMGEGMMQALVIYRADEMLREAYQALLKTLEEPTEHSLFVLYASSSSLPETILSRVEKYPFFTDTPSAKKDELENMLLSRRAEIEASIAKARAVPRHALMELKNAVRAVSLLHTSRVSERSISEYIRATLE